MTNYKPILALSSLGAGIAVMLFAVQLQRERFAFTTGIGRTLDATANVTLVPSMPQQATVNHSLFIDPAREVGSLRATPASLLAIKPATRRAAAQPVSVEPLRECNPVWRELESGPAGRRVREIC